MPTQCSLHIGKVSQKYLKEFLELLPTQDLNNQGDNCRMESELSFLNVICLLNLLYIFVKYHDMKISLSVLKLWFAQNFDNFWRLGVITYGPCQLMLLFLHPTPLLNALYNLTELRENSSKGIGVIGCTIMRLWTDGWMNGWIP